MRNIFDQYKHPENRLTHALACCLANDARFMSAFVCLATGAAPPKGHRLQVIEQGLPGVPEPDEVKPDEHKSLPDAWIHNNDDWALLVESKVASPISQDQIRRHLQTAKRRGYTDNRIVILSVNPPSAAGKPGVTHLAWKALYLLAKEKTWRTPWPVTLADYMEAAEGRMLKDGYLDEGTLTTFTGIDFGGANP